MTSVNIKKAAARANQASVIAARERTKDNIRRLHRLELEYGGTAADLAVRMGVSVSTISRWRQTCKVCMYMPCRCK